MSPDKIVALPYRRNVGIMLANEAGRVFAGQRIDALRLGTGETAWQMPQGGIDGDETPAEAALRELEEETGVRPDLVSIEAENPEWLTYDLPDELVGKVWKGRYRGQKQRWFLMRFHGDDSQIVIDTAHPEFRRWVWIEPARLMDRVVPFKRDVYARVLEAFEGRL